MLDTDLHLRNLEDLPTEVVRFGQCNVNLSKLLDTHHLSVEHKKLCNNKCTCKWQDLG
jgi:hypothetical protein